VDQRKNPDRVTALKAFRWSANSPIQRRAFCEPASALTMRRSHGGQHSLQGVFAMFRIATLFVAAVAVFALAADIIAADKTHDGLVVSVAEGKLVMTDNAGKNEHSHAIGATTKITLDGKEAKLADLKKGDKITVTQDDTNKVTAVAATRPAK
jgi:hypothetical protein